MDIVGTTPEAFTGRFEEFADRLHPDDRDGTLQAVRAHLEERQPYDVEYRLQHRSGKWVWIRAKGQASWNDAGSPTRMVGTVSDITEPVATRNALALKNKQLQRSNDDLERFAAIASHDMKEPLRKIRQFSDRMIASGAISDAKASDYLGRIKKSADRMYNMVTDVLEISRVGSARSRRSRLDLNRLAHRAVDGLSPVIQDVNADIDISALPAVLGNEVQVAQVIHNLLDNALKYRARTRRPQIQIDTAAPSSGDFVAIQIRDNGIGFEDRFRSRIFDLFERLHGKSEYSGTGLGLALCKRIMEEHGGQISARSDVDVGSCFVLEFPRPGNATLLEERNNS